MIKYYVLFILILTLLPAVVSGHPGWFGNIRGGGVPMHHPSIYPDALSNVVYAYGHLEDKNKKGEVTNVKSTSSTKTKWSDNNYEEEDHFFHALYHNNDDKVVTKVSTKKYVGDSEDGEDEAMFERLHDKIFHRRRGSCEEGKDEDIISDIADVAFGFNFEDVIEECSFFE